MSLKYTEDHEWVRLQGDIATIGISEHAQDSLGDIVFVELPEAGSTHAQKDAVGVVESVKAASDIYMPVTGEIIEINEALLEDPAIVNSDAQGEGWFFRVKVAEPSQLDSLLDEAAYKAFCED